MTLTLEELAEKVRALTTKGLGPRPHYAEVDVHPPVFVCDGAVRVSSEEPNSMYWVDYYGEFRGGLPYINPVLEQFAEANDMFWEWENPGCIALWTK